LQNIQETSIIWNDAHLGFSKILNTFQGKIFLRGRVQI
jgi:hypothetical protein